MKTNSLFKLPSKNWDEKDGSISILIPIYNEKEIIREFILEWQIEVFNFLPSNSKLIIEDGASNDGTSEIISELKKEYKNIIHNRKNSRDGFGNALKNLLRIVETDWFLVSDGDGQFAPQDFWLLADSRQNYDLLKGAKISRMDPFFRRISSLFFNKLVNAIFNCDFSDINAGFFLAKKEILNVVKVEDFKMDTLVTTELLIKSYLANYDIKQIFVSHRIRKNGKSRGISTGKYLRTGAKAIKLLFDIKNSYRI